MRISHVITRLVVGGAQENTVASVLGLRDVPGFSVELISGPTVGPEGSLEPLVSRIPGLLTVEPTLVRPVNPWLDVRAYWRLRRHFSRSRIDIVHTHSGKAGVLGRLAARSAGVRLVIHTVHGPSFGPFQGSLANAAFKTAEKIAGRATDHFVVVADAMSRQYLDAGIGHLDQYTKVYSGFHLTPFLEARRDPELDRRLGLKGDEIVVGKIARLFENKGHEDLLAMAPELIRREPRIRILLLGDGELRRSLEATACAMGIRECVMFAGLVPPSEVPRYLASMDILVHLSRREGLARALPQALAAGRPVVAYDADGASEVCRTGETGVLVKVGDRDGVRDGVLNLAQNPELRQRLGETGRQWVRERFPTERMVAELEGLYRRLMSGRGDAGRQEGRE